jgi:hypothetical protein
MVIDSIPQQRHNDVLSDVGGSKMYLRNTFESSYCGIFSPCKNFWAIEVAVLSNTRTQQ